MSRLDPPLRPTDFRAHRQRGAKELEPVMHVAMVAQLVKDGAVHVDLPEESQS